MKSLLGLQTTHRTYATLLQGEKQPEICLTSSGYQALSSPTADRSVPALSALVQTGDSWKIYEGMPVSITHFMRIQVNRR
jgi:hypothetical protein